MNKVFTVVVTFLCIAYLLRCTLTFTVVSESWLRNDKPVHSRRCPVTVHLFAFAKVEPTGQLRHQSDSAYLLCQSKQERRTIWRLCRLSRFATRTCAVPGYPNRDPSAVQWTSGRSKWWRLDPRSMAMGAMIFSSQYRTKIMCESIFRKKCSSLIAYFVSYLAVLGPYTSSDQAQTRQKQQV